VTVQPHLESKDVRFAYEDGPPVLQGISISIEPGEFVAVIGQNGSGKTTLVKHFNGLLRPTEGQVLLDGEDISDKTVGALARSVGYVFQNPDHQIFSVTTREEIAVGPTNFEMDEGEVAVRTADALERFHLTEYADRQPATLGFGLRRKVSIAAIYAMQTPIMILDEPSTGLDWKSTTELMQLIQELNEQGRTIILITHDMRVVAEYAPRCMVIREGEVLAHEDTRDIFKQVHLLKSTHIEVPQISKLGHRMVPHGLQDGILTVPEFCDAYNDLIKRG
jgi:energy-coupling factor transport system ATP-binding protein